MKYIILWLLFAMTWSDIEHVAIGSILVGLYTLFDV